MIKVCLVWVISLCAFRDLIITVALAFAQGEMMPDGETDILSDMQQLTGWAAVGQIRVYNGIELIDYINGGAEIYFAYNFKEVCVNEYRNSKGTLMTVEVYEMDKSENAYGVYSFDTKGESVQIGREAIYGDGLLRFWKARFFVRIFAASTEANTRQHVLSFGRVVAENIPGFGSKPGIISVVPTGHLVPGSVHYFHKNVLLNNFYYISDANILKLSEKTEAVTYEYEFATQPLRVILIQYPVAEDAEDAYLSFNKSYFYDRMPSTDELLSSSTSIYEVEEKKYTGIEVVNDYVIAVFEADDVNSCRKMLDIQSTRLRY